MASRKTKPREKKPARPPRPNARTGQGAPGGELVSAAPAVAEESRPSSTMTREVEIVALGSLLDAARELAPGASPIPEPPTTRVLDDLLLDDLAQTAEAPSASRILLLDAGETVFSELGFVRTTDKEVARVAGVSLDVFHAHFASKTALLHALSDRFCSQAITATNEATKTGIWEQATPREVVEVAVRSMLDVVLGRRGLVRAVLMSGDEGLIDGFRQVGLNITEKVLGVIDALDFDSAAKPEPRDVAFALLLAISIAHHTIMIGPEWCGLDDEGDEVYERVAHAVTAYLEDAPRRRHGDRS